MDSPDSDRARQAAVECAVAMLNGQLGLLEGCQRMAGLARALVDNWFDDPDFVLFGAVASESDGLPLGSARQYWSAEALAREDRKIERYESLVKEQVSTACRNVVARFTVDPHAGV